MPRKGRKKNAPLLLVASEPLGDELETDIMWDVVKEVKDKPYFMDGSLLDATRACFDGEKGQDRTGEAARTAFMGRVRHLPAPRACDQFLQAEEELKKMMKNVENIREDVKEFELLKENEKEEAQRDREKVAAAAMKLITELSDTRLTLLEGMEEAEEEFFTKQNEILENLTALAAKDNEVEEAFLEQLMMKRKCRETEEKYFEEHGDHVVLMAEMQYETRRQQEEMLHSMIHRLEEGIGKMTKLSVEELEDKSAQQEEMSQLIVELLKVQGKSVLLEKKTTSITEQRTSLQRTIALELQKQQHCIERQKLIRAELNSLSAKVRENDLRLLALTSNTTPTSAYTAALPMMPTSPNTISNLTKSDEEEGLAFLVVEAQRELEVGVTELANNKSELLALRRQHLVQLSGQYQPVNLDNSSIRTTQDFFLDGDTKAAVRSVVVEALMQVSHILGVSNGTSKTQDDLERLLSVTDLEDRKAVQDYVARRINTLFSCICPTAPPLLFLCEAAHVQ